MCMKPIIFPMIVKVAKQLVELDKRHNFRFKYPQTILKQKLKFKSNPFSNS